MVPEDTNSQPSLPQDHYVDVGTVKTRYWAGGEGRPVVLIHGFADSVETWSQVFGRLAGHHRVFALDVIGAGRTEKPAGPMPFPKLARFVRDFMDTQGIDKASVVGQSMGGGIALSLAIRWPEKIDKLIIVDSAGLGRDLPLALRICTLPGIGWFLTRGTRKQTASFLRRCVHDPALMTTELVETVCERGRLPDAHAAMRAWLRSNADLGGWRNDVVRPIVEKLGFITAPTLIVWGRQDWVIPVSHASVAGKGIPGARLHVFDPCGHVPQLERAEEFGSLVVEFLGG